MKVVTVMTTVMAAAAAMTTATAATTATLMIMEMETEMETATGMGMGTVVILAPVTTELAAVTALTSFDGVTTTVMVRAKAVEGITIT